MTRCDSCARPALIRQNDALYCEVCYCVNKRATFQTILDITVWYSLDWIRAYEKIVTLNELLGELRVALRKRKKVA